MIQKEKMCELRKRIRKLEMRQWKRKRKKGERKKKKREGRMRKMFVLYDESGTRKDRGFGGARGVHGRQQRMRTQYTVRAPAPHCCCSRAACVNICVRVCACGCECECV